jgi:hypothetical protein
MYVQNTTFYSNFKVGGAISTTQPPTPNSIGNLMQDKIYNNFESKNVSSPNTIHLNKKYLFLVYGIS